MATVWQDPRESVVGIVVAWLYCALQESGPRGATLGKRVVGLRVTDLEGRRISFLRATGRHFAKYLSVAISGFGYLMALFTARRQALHDMMAGSLVLDREG